MTSAAWDSRKEFHRKRHDLTRRLYGVNKFNVTACTLFQQPHITVLSRSPTIATSDPILKAFSYSFVDDKCDFSFWYFFNVINLFDFDFLFVPSITWRHNNLSESLKMLLHWKSDSLRRHYVSLLYLLLCIVYKHVYGWYWLSTLWKCTLGGLTKLNIKTSDHRHIYFIQNEFFNPCYALLSFFFLFFSRWGSKALTIVVKMNVSALAFDGSQELCIARYAWPFFIIII